MLPVCAVTAQYNDELRHVEYAVEKYSQMLFRICYNILENKQDTEDAVQETFLKYMVKAPLFKDSDHEKAWLIKVATNISKNISRYNNRHAAENFDELREIGLDLPDSMAITTALKKAGMDIDIDCLTMDEAAEQIAKVLKK